MPERIENGDIIRSLVRVESMGGDIAEIKETIKKMAEAIQKLAVIEDRQVTDRDDIRRAHGRITGLEERTKLLELAQPLQRQATDWVSKLAWLVVGAVATALVSMVLIRPTQSASAARASDIPMAVPAR